MGKIFPNSHTSSESVSVSVNQVSNYRESVIINKTEVREKRRKKSDTLPWKCKMEEIKEFQLVCAWISKQVVSEENGMFQCVCGKSIDGIELTQRGIKQHLIKVFQLVVQLNWAPDNQSVLVSLQPSSVQDYQVHFCRHLQWFQLFIDSKCIHLLFLGCFPFRSILSVWTVEFVGCCNNWFNLNNRMFQCKCV